MEAEKQVGMLADTLREVESEMETVIVTVPDMLVERKANTLLRTLGDMRAK